MFNGSWFLFIAAKVNFFDANINAADQKWSVLIETGVFSCFSGPVFRHNCLFPPTKLHWNVSDQPRCHRNARWNNVSTMATSCLSPAVISPNNVMLLQPVCVDENSPHRTERWRKSHIFLFWFCKTDELKRSGPSHGTGLFLISPEERGPAEDWETEHLCLRGKGLQKTESSQTDSLISTVRSNQNDVCIWSHYSVMTRNMKLCSSVTWTWFTMLLVQRRWYEFLGPGDTTLQ